MHRHEMAFLWLATLYVDAEKNMQIGLGDLPKAMLCKRIHYPWNGLANLRFGNSEQCGILSNV